MAKPKNRFEWAKRQDGKRERCELKSEIALCYEAGMDSYIPKPYQVEELIGTIYNEIKK